MIKGTVKFFDEKKGYGFIAGDNRKDYFFHYSDIQMEGYKKAEKNQRVTFEVIQSDRGEKAGYVCLEK
ncbi:cold-shock protein [Holdemania filiformis]|uniref:cold-shock protein n=1 Tax=Holdemania filiformis TaxID=61171 RepID=UPI00242C048A|nr:cold shock domain-containing protein [Holdemania filiformis]MBS5001078.1 cold shock domain-containing protein [Holdemania filiformis]